MRSKKTYGEKSPNFQKKHFKQLSAASWLSVYLCVEEGGGHLKDIVHKKWNYVKKCEAP